MHEMVETLNEMALGRPREQQPAAAPMTRAQASIFSNLDEAARAMGPPPQGLSPSGAFASILGSVPYDDVPPSLAAFNHTAVSLPSLGSRPVGMQVLLEPHGNDVVENFITRMVLPQSAARAKLRKSGIRSCYSDPKLQQGQNWPKFCLRMKSAHMLDFALSVEEECGVFFVEKKDKVRLRLIIDARRANCHFEDPDYIPLASGSSLGEIELEPGHDLYIGHGDLCDAFYHFALPLQLRRFFGLPRVRAGVVGVTEVQGRAVSPETWVHPRLAVVPMGWSHAAWFCQLIHMTVVRKEHFTTDAAYIHDNIPVPSMSTGAHTEYLDNFLAFGIDQREVREATEDAMATLVDKGLEVHEVQLADTQAAILGWEIDGKAGWISAGRHRRWRLRYAIDHILSLRRVSGRTISRVIGHYTFMALITRPALSVCHAWI